MKHSFNQLHVYCTHKDRRDGCKWSGELLEFEKHLNENGSEETQLLGCKFVEILCEFHYAGCKVETAGEDMATHMSEQLSYHTELLTGKINEQNKHNVMERLTKSLHHKDAIIHELQEKLTSAKTDSSRLQRKDEQLAQKKMQKAAQNLPIYNHPMEKLITLSGDLCWTWTSPIHCDICHLPVECKSAAIPLITFLVGY